MGVEGLALLRHLYDGSDDAAARRLREVRTLLDDDAFAVGEPVGEVDATSGYDSWSSRYDAPGNPIIGLEEPVVRSLIEGLPPGPALDAACGTGRHARHLAARGHVVVGVDRSRGMLGRARAGGAAVGLVAGDLRRLPIAGQRFALVVAGLALAHVSDLAGAVAELSRVLAPGGHLVVSALHPLQAALGWHAPFEDGQGRRRFVREHAHTHADYFTALTAAGLEVRDLIEPALSEVEVRAKRRATRHMPEATLAAYLGLPAVLIWHARKPQPGR